MIREKLHPKLIYSLQVCLNILFFGYKLNSFTEKGIAGDPESRPAFISPLRALSVEEGAPLIILAPFIGNPIPDVSWTKDGIPVKPDERTLITCDGKKVTLL